MTKNKERDVPHEEYQFHSEKDTQERQDLTRRKPQGKAHEFVREVRNGGQHSRGKARRESREYRDDGREENDHEAE